MIKNIFSILLFSMLSFGYFSCSEESNPVFDQNNFTKIYDNNSFSAAFYPIDVQQTADGGYIVLTRIDIENSQFFETYLLKADKEGNFEKEVYLDANLVNPVGEFMKVGDTYTFFCMDEFRNTQLVSMDGDLENITVTPVNGMTYPYVATLDNTNFILQSYSDVNKKTAVSIVNPSGVFLPARNLIWEQALKLILKLISYSISSSMVKRFLFK